MAEFLHIEVDNDLRAGLKFEEFPDALREELVAEIDALAHEAFTRERAAIPVRTGKLQGQLRQVTHNDPKRIKGAIYIDGQGSGSGSDFAKAGALEYGSTGRKFDVGARRMKLDHFWEHRLRAPMEVLVKAYSRHSTIMEHRFARGTLEAMAPEILQRLEAVVAKTTKQASED